MGGTRYWLRRKKSKADEGNQKRKSSGNVKRSGTSSSSNHLTASDGSCPDFCKLEKGRSFAVKVWNPLRKKTSPPDMQKDTGSEASYEKFKNSTVQLKPSLNVRTSLSQQDKKSATPAVRNKISAVSLKPSLDLNHSPETPGIIKTEIPLLSKKFQVRNRYPSDIRIFRYNQNVISSPNSSPGSTEKSAGGSRFSSPSSLIGLSGARKTLIQSRGIMGTTSIESTDSLFMEPSEKRFVSPFGRKFSSRGLFSAAQDQKKDKAESTKYIKTKDQVLMKKVDIVDPPTENKILESMQSDSIIKISPSQSAAKSTHDINQADNLRVDDAVTEKEMLDSVQTDIFSQISPCTSPLSRSFVKLTNDGEQAKIFYMDDAATQNDMLEPMQTDGHSQISSSTSPTSEPILKLTCENNKLKYMQDDAAIENETLEPMQIHSHIHISPSTSPLSQSPSPLTHHAVKLTRENEREKILHVRDATNEMFENIQIKLHVNDATTENEVLEPKQIGDHIQISPSTSPLSGSDVILTHDSDHTEVFYVGDVKTENEILDTDGHRKVSPSASSLSRSAVSLTHDNDHMKSSRINGMTTKNHNLEFAQDDGRSQISLSTSQILKANMKLMSDMDQSKNLHMDAVETEDEVLESMQTDDHIQISPHTSSLSLSIEKFTHDNDQAKILHMSDAVTENEMLKHMETDGHIYPLSRSPVTFAQYNNRTENLHVNATKSENGMLKLKPIDGFNLLSSPTSPLSPYAVILAHEIDRIKLLHVNDATTKNQISELVQIDDHSQISSSTSQVSQSALKLTRDKDDAKNDKLEPMQNDGYSKASLSDSSLSQSAMRLTYDNNHLKILQVNGVATRNEMLESEQNDGHSEISPSSPLFKSGKELTLDKNHAKKIHVEDLATENEVLEPIQTNDNIPISSSTSPLLWTDEKITHGNDQDKMSCMASKKEMLELVQTVGHTHISQSTSPLAQYRVTLANDNAMILQVNDATKENEMLEPMQSDDHSKVSSFASPLSRLDVKVTRNYDHTKILQVNDLATKNEMLESAEIDGHTQISPSTSPFSKSDKKLTSDKNQAKHGNEATENLCVDIGATENEMLKPIQTDGHIQISPSTSLSSHLTMKVAHDNDKAKILHLVDAITKNEMLELMQTNDVTHISPSTSSLSQKITHDDNQVEILHVVNVETENGMLEFVQAHDDSQISSCTSPISQSDVKLTHDNDQTRILMHMLDAATRNKMLESDGHIQISTSSQSTMKLTRDDDQARILHVIDTNEDEWLEPVQTDGHNKISESTSSLFQSHASSEAHSELLPSHADESVEPKCTDIEISKFYEDIDIEALQDIEYIDIYDSGDSEYVEEIDEINIENDDVVNIDKIDTSMSLHHTKKGRRYTLEDKDSPISKSMLQRGRIVDLESENDISSKIKFGREKVMENEIGTKTYVGVRRLIVDNTNSTSPNTQCTDSYDSEGKFRRVRIVDLQSENVDVPKRLKFRRRRVVEDEYVDSCYSEDSTEFNSKNDDVVNINEVDILEGEHPRNSRKGKQFTSEEYNPANKYKFRRGRILDLQTENDIPSRLKFRRVRVIENEDGTKTYVDRVRFKRRDIDDNTNTTSPDSEYIDSYYSEDSESETTEFNSENGDVVNINNVDILQGKDHRHFRKDKQFTSEEDSPAYKYKFRRGRIVDLQNDDNVPRRLKFRRGRVIENDDGTKIYVQRRRFKKTEILDNVDITSPDSPTAILRHQEMQEKKDELLLFNDVIEETVTKLARSRKNSRKGLLKFSWGIELMLESNFL
ncbi:hypothetical protein POM88_053319 [Heracleum sosnowskyi]|uniref:Calmodulin-binding domain-containing protein n=1 Tax=Heracleum sosnowskyi TaxID=360622 RepID=A0AAD8LVT1_9APIA|nr:hypothetical protein POM88_053319 [Heracleum sosnowskyi]